MDSRFALDRLLERPTPLLALAPMQDVTNLAFWNLLANYGGPDLYFTEYFRVHASSTLDRRILKSVTESPAGRPVVAQLIGNDIPALCRTASLLQEYPIAAVDLNLGCPAPVVYRKCAGGGLLRDPARVDAILGALRDAVKIKFTVKTRLGFDSTEVFAEMLPIFARHGLDLLTVHARTVQAMYRNPVHYQYVAQAVAALRCPVLANGNIDSADAAVRALESTGARGLMMGRGAIRNPWLFGQIRQRHSGQAEVLPRGHEVLGYVRALYEAECDFGVSDLARVQRMKKFMNYLGAGVEPSGQFLSQIRRVATSADFFRICERFLNHGDPMPLAPFPEHEKQGVTL